MTGFWRLLVLAAAACDTAAESTAELALAETAPSYRVTNLDSLGGTIGAGNSVNDRGWVAGFSNLAGDGTTHAALWRGGALKDLDTLGGPNSDVAWPVKNDRGIISGIAELAELNPLGELWSCSAFFPSATGRICRGFVWDGGAPRALPTLGGYNGFATGTNNRGQTVGWAENGVADATCNPPQVLQFRAVVWGPGGAIRELPPLPGDTVSSATAINDRGQVAGISGICDNAVGRFSAAHIVLWEDGVPTNLGDLGGLAWNTAMAMNEQGDVVGFANRPINPARRFNAHAFLWTRKGGIRDLGTLPGDTLSEGLGINARRQVVGMSCTAGFASCRAFLWEDGQMTDLNDLAPGYADHLVFANDINDLGWIAGQAALHDSGASVAFQAVPSHVPRPRPRATAAPRLSEDARQMLLERLGLRGAEL